MTKQQNTDPADVRASETPVERAQRLGQGDEINPAVPTGQTSEDVARSIPAHDSNEELRIAASKRGEGIRAGDDRTVGNDERGQVTR
jgi:hypothetical protein